MISHKLLTAVIFTLIIGGLAKLTPSDEEFLRRLSKVTLSEVKSEYRIGEVVQTAQRYNGSQLVPTNGYKLALFPPFFIDLIYNTGRQPQITQNAASEGDRK
uniref:Uncharacterized protein n=1 Tax=Bactrocera latifrons TaxID=174628 RepID=A0A0K8W220_BACLA